MIVICTHCHAKFRVADDKVGPRGAKVRCSKCQTVFMVHPDLGTVPLAPAPVFSPPAPSPSARPSARPPPSLEVDLEPARSRPPAPPPLPSRAPVADSFGGADPFAPPGGDPFAPAGAPQAAAGRPVPRGDPFAGMAAPDPFDVAAGADPFAAGPGAPDSSWPVAPPDPFAAASGAADPFDVAAPAAPSSAPAADPFSGVEDPFRAAVEPRPPQRSSLPVTDLSALLDGPNASAAPPPLRAAAPAPPAAATSAPFDFSGDFDPEPGGADLALEERTTPPPSAALPADTLPTPDLLAGLAGSEPDAAEAGFFVGAEDSIPLATDATPPAAVKAAGASALPRSPPRRGPPAPRPAAAAPEADRIPGGRSPLRSITVNAVSLVALLVVVLAIRVVWHGEWSVDAAGLRHSAIATALGAGESHGPFATAALTNGIYERATGAPLLWVKGRVISRAPAPVRAVSVAVEVVRDGRVVARGAALAGAVPTPEELHGATTPAALDKLAAAIRGRAPAEIRPGDEVPFLVALSDAPDDLSGASLRVKASPAGAAP